MLTQTSADLAIVNNAPLLDVANPIEGALSKEGNSDVVSNGVSQN